MSDCIKIGCIILWLLLVVKDGKAQEKPVFRTYQYNVPDSLEELTKLKPGDTTKISHQVNYSLTIIGAKPDSAFWLLNDALAKSRKLKYDVGIAAALCDLGYYNNRKGDYNISIIYYREGLPYAEKAFRNSTSLAMYYTSMCTPFYYASNYDSISYYVYKAEALINNRKLKSTAEAIDVCSVYTNIGMLWNSLGNYQKAQDYLQKGERTLRAFAHVPKKKNSDELYKLTMSIVFADLGMNFMGQKKPDSAHIFFDSALVYNNENAAAMSGIAKIFQQKKETAKAAEMFRQVIELTEATQNYTDNMYAKAGLAMVAVDQKDYKKAELLLADVITDLKLKPGFDIPNVYEAYHTLATVKAALGNYKKAYDFEEISIHLLDSLYAQQKYQSIYELELKSRTAEKDKSIAQKQLLLAQQASELREKNMWMGIIGTSAALLIISLISLYTNNKNKQRLQEKKILSMQQEQEINNLRSTIEGEEKERARMARELHDGIMVRLSTVKMSIKTLPEQYRSMSSEDYVHTNYYRQIIQQMEDATKELRHTAHNLMPDMLLQGGLAEAVFYFCNSLQQNTGLIFSCQQYDEIARMQPEFELSVYRIIQELLQNVIKHAQATKVMVQLSRPLEETLAITIEDDGVGFDAKDQHDGMGLKSIRNRVQAMGGIIDLSSDIGNGTMVHLEFDIPKAD